MFSQKDREWARNIIAALSIPDEFGIEGEGNDFYCDSIEDQLQAAFPDEFFHIFNGVSKCVIVPDAADFVLKIPFNGIWTPDWDNTDEDDDEPVYTFFPFLYACREAEDDYCRDEYEKLKIAREAGFGELFAELEPIGMVGIHTVYIQERVNLFLVGSIKPSKVALAHVAESKGSTYDFVRPKWRAAIYDFYGPDYWEGFVDWENFCGEDFTSDLHSGNYGTRMDGRPVIFDFAGFRD